MLNPSSKYARDYNIAFDSVVVDFKAQLLFGRQFTDKDVFVIKELLATLSYHSFRKCFSNPISKYANCQLYLGLVSPEFEKSSRFSIFITFFWRD